MNPAAEVQNLLLVTNQKLTHGGLYIPTIKSSSLSAKSCEQVLAPQTSCSARASSNPLIFGLEVLGLVRGMLAGLERFPAQSHQAQQRLINFCEMLFVINETRSQKLSVVVLRVPSAAHTKDICRASDKN